MQRVRLLTSRLGLTQAQRIATGQLRSALQNCFEARAIPFGGQLYYWTYTAFARLTACPSLLIDLELPLSLPPAPGLSCDMSNQPAASDVSQILHHYQIEPFSSYELDFTSSLWCRLTRAQWCAIATVAVIWGTGPYRLHFGKRARCLLSSSMSSNLYSDLDLSHPFCDRIVTLIFIIRSLASQTLLP